MKVHGIANHFSCFPAKTQNFKWTASSQRYNFVLSEIYSFRIFTVFFRIMYHTPETFVCIIINFRLGKKISLQDSALTVAETYN